ncbi:hypothetical protein A6F53_07860 [Levilactobacillus brevis]|uniref:alkaline shock response membrane anchor protein AmaP n=1 Tax=Levilactobacillus brevis TaxID=1580 RepID=UPI0007F8AD71|nr:alkaline shock response membrane anchor protein AmaP [Levilactobacillus brevis]ANN49162.1 hypothetical protein A6F53_07860 [Levilactobacillus brevis]ATU69107.1 alkaline shock response membrane anchor protein AmaP [Levilactobacillus brevis]MDM5046452.1 alkaline shock response membrane anchor protein AmaP [Levilactobacillus brevis]
MRRRNKVLLTILGLILLALAVLQIGWWLPIPGLSAWSTDVSYTQMFWLKYALAGAVIIVGIVGLVFMMMGIFKPIREKQWQFTNQIGMLEVPQAAIEKALRQQLAEQVGVIDPQVTIKLLRHKRVRMKAVAQVSSADQIDSLAEQAEQVIENYLQRQLDLTVTKPVVQLSPVDRKQHVSVV